MQRLLLQRPCKHEKGYFYVNGDDVERYAKKYKFIAVSEKMLDNKLASLKAGTEKVMKPKMISAKMNLSNL